MTMDPLYLYRIKVSLVEPIQGLKGLWGIRTKYERISQNDKLLFDMFKVPEEERDEVLKAAMKAFQTAFLEEISKRSRKRRKNGCITN